MENAIKDFFNKMAPHWNDSPKNEKIPEYLDMLPLKEGMKVLDLGCGTGKISELLYQKVNRKITAIDLSENMIEIAQKTNDNSHIDFRCLDFYQFDEVGYDFIICFDAYPHFLDVESFVEKANNLLNDGGFVAILHDLGRKSLESHHRDIFNISRHLESPECEIKPFLKHFKEIRKEESDNHYLLLLQK